MTVTRRYDALLLDLDGTIVDHDGEIRPRTIEAVRLARDAGVHVMVATGRSEPATHPVLEVLGLEEHDAVVFNGAARYSPRSRRLTHQFTLTERIRDDVLGHAHEKSYLPVSMFEGKKFAPEPRNEIERAALADMHRLETAEWERIREPSPGERPIRLTLYSDQHPTSQAFADEIAAQIADPVFLTHFPLGILPHHHGSPLIVLDVHPPCRGKSEALDYLATHVGIPSERVVAIGDAGNDIEMLRDAGLGVCMAEAAPDVQAVADRMIGACSSDTVAELIDELFLTPAH